MDAGIVVAEAVGVGERRWELHTRPCCVAPGPRATLLVGADHGPTTGATAGRDGVPRPHGAPGVGALRRAHSPEGRAVRRVCAELRPLDVAHEVEHRLLEALLRQLGHLLRPPAEAVGIAAAMVCRDAPGSLHHGAGLPLSRPRRLEPQVVLARVWAQAVATGSAAVGAGAAHRAALGVPSVHAARGEDGSGARRAPGHGGGPVPKLSGAEVPVRVGAQGRVPGDGGLPWDVCPIRVPLAAASLRARLSSPRGRAARAACTALLAGAQADGTMRVHPRGRVLHCPVPRGARRQRSGEDGQLHRAAAQERGGCRAGC
mmetsp:Transcript_148189/g.412722  ORF Transcript_148189/g.412722 Transcript_148189/m.412722 type:complete len:316 (+) Transcript_148189:324-1271(+)